MPILNSPEQPRTIQLPPRQGLEIAKTDVLVVGGGPSGLGAAVGAADAGAEVILAEKYGFLGGNATAALVTYFMSFYIEKPDQPLTYPPHLHGEPIIGGVLETFINLLISHRGAEAPTLQSGYIVPFDPEIFKYSAEELLNRSGVQFLYHVFASGVTEEEKLDGVIFESKSGPLVIKAKAIIDCTGDGDIAFLAGAPYKIGRESDGLVQPMTLMFRITEFNSSLFDGYVKEHPDQWRTHLGLWDLIRKATEEGRLNLPREDMLFFHTPYRKELSVNSTRITRALGTSVWDLTRAEFEGRQQVQEIARFLREYVPGFADTYVIQSGVNAGVRETRRILGDYILTADDVLGAHKFEDVIARGSYPIDIHNPQGRGTILKHLSVGESYDIPLRCLLPQKVENLLTAGRCISGTNEALASYRIMPISMATGQAAGVCAALAVNQGNSPRTTDFRMVQKELIRQGANLGGQTGITDARQS